jgi:predicted GIY-YIG superfamily endonuclease
MHYVYILQSESHPDQTYIGLTDNLKARLKKHNEDGSPHTSKYRPWQIKSYHAFNSREKAAESKKYLKSGSGRAFEPLL